MGPRSHLWFFILKAATLALEKLVSMGPSPHLWFLHAKSDFSIRITSLHGSQTSPVVLCMQNNLISIRNTSLYGSQPSCLVFAKKTATLDQNYKSLCVTDFTYVFWHSKQRLWHQNCKSLWVSSLICGFYIQNSYFSTRIASLYGSQLSSVDFACKTATFESELQVSMGPRPHLSFCACKTA